VSHPHVLVATADGVRTITLHRPDKRNALTRAMRDELVRRAGEVDEDPAVSVLVITGTDPAFSAGVDLTEIASGAASDAVPGTAPDAPPGTANPGRSPAGSLPGTANPGAALQAVRKPVIAAVNGACFTGALEIALSCDVIVASERASFGDTHARFGLMPYWGMSVRLPERVGVAKARELSLTGRTVDAVEARRIGLVEHVVGHDELLAFVAGLAGDMAASDQAAVLGMQELYDLAPGRTLAERQAEETARARAHRFDLAAFEARRAARFGSR
jgi:enoyl-CoA hydratase